MNNLLPQLSLSSVGHTWVQAVSELKLQRSDSLENLLTCAICLDFLYEPVRSICGHSFCRTCLRRLLEYDGSQT